MPRKLTIQNGRPRSDKFDIGMTPRQYREIEERLGRAVRTADSGRTDAALGRDAIAAALGLRPRILVRYAAGEVPIRQVVAYALRALAAEKAG